MPAPSGGRGANHGRAASECLPEAEVERIVSARFRLHRTDSIEPVAEVEAYRADDREHAQARAGRVVEVAEVELRGRHRDVAAVEEHHSADAHLADRAELTAQLD